MGSAIGDYIHLTYSGYYEKTGALKEPFASGYTRSIENKEKQFEDWVRKQENIIIGELQKETQASLNLLKSFRTKEANNKNIEENEVVMALLDDL